MPFKEDLVERLEAICRMMDLLGEDSFRANAHARAARAIADLATDISLVAGDAAALVKIEGVGPKIAEKIVEFHTTGRITHYDDLCAKVPAGLLALLRLSGLGPKTLRVLWQEGGVTDAASLARIIEDGSILKLPRMGAKSVEKLKAAMVFAGSQGGAERLALGMAMPVAEIFVERLSKIPGVKKIAFAGSLRRGKDTIGDLDIIIAADDPGPVSEAFRTMPEVEQVLAAGPTKSSVRVSIAAVSGRRKPDAVGGFQSDLRVVAPKSWGAALMYFSGSKEHNVALRERSLKRGLTLNEYGLFPNDKEDTPPQSRGVRPVAGKTEEGIYKALGLPYIPPEIRENQGELSLKETPRLIELGDIKAELHAHTTASDGRFSITELAMLAKLRGFHTIAVTDHSKSSAIAGGLSPDRLREHIKAVRAANEQARAAGSGITILAGSEVDILSDGRLDYDDHLLAQLDIVVASPHAALTQDPAVATARLLKAIQNPMVHILGHPTGRIINKRAGLSPAISELVAAAKEHNVALEINAHWLRLDLRDVHVRAAVDAGCLIAINCDSHEPSDFDNLRYGVLTARRGWVTPEICVNAWPANRLHGWLKGKR